MCDAVLGAEVPVTTKQAAVEAVTKLPPYLEKYTSRTVPARTELLHLCERFTAKYEESLVLRANILSMYDLVYNKLIIVHQPY